MVRIEATDLSKMFRVGSSRIIAVDSVDVTIEDGTFVTLLGPSGCGKTTLLRMLGGLETPTSGKVFFDNENVTEQSVQDRRISMVFQSIALFPFKSVRENIEYGLKYTDTPKEEREQAAQEMAEMVGIGELMDNSPNQLSGGQRQRVALSRALVRNPTVFLLDEPMSDLDAELKVDLRTQLKELHKEFQTTTLYVTHDQEEAMTLSEEVIVMDGGEIQQQSPPFELYDNPDNMFVARFIGSPNINFFDGDLDGTTITVGAFDRPITIHQDIAKTIERELTGEDLKVGIRPNALTLDDDDSYLTSSATVYEQLGDGTIIHTETETEDGTQVVRAMGPPTFTPDEGEIVSWTFDLRDVHLFDGDTGEAILNGISPPAQTADMSEETKAD